MQQTLPSFQAYGLFFPSLFCLHYNLLSIIRCRKWLANNKWTCQVTTRSDYIRNQVFPIQLPTDWRVFAIKTYLHWHELRVYDITYSKREIKRSYAVEIIWWQSRLTADIFSGGIQYSATSISERVKPGQIHCGDRRVCASFVNSGRFIYSSRVF